MKNSKSLVLDLAIELERGFDKNGFSNYRHTEYLDRSVDMTNNAINELKKEILLSIATSG